MLTGGNNDWNKIYQPRREKTGLLHMRKTKTQISGTREADQRPRFLYIDKTIPLLPIYESSSL